VEPNAALREDVYGHDGYSGDRRPESVSKQDGHVLSTTLQVHKDVSTTKALFLAV